MARSHSSIPTRKRRKKILKQAKGYFGHKHIGFRTANEQVCKGLTYAFRDRKQRKRQFRRLWITRINAAAGQFNISYSQLMYGLKLSNIEINRKMLSEIAISDLKEFESFVLIAKDALEIEKNKELI